MREQDSTKMEFLLTLNDNIVVQRFFNVRGYNPKARNSTELYDFILSLKDELQYALKMKTVIYMMDNKDAIVFSVLVIGILCLFAGVIGMNYWDAQQVRVMYQQA